MRLANKIYNVTCVHFVRDGLLQSCYFQVSWQMVVESVLQSGKGANAP